MVDTGLARQLEDLRDAWPMLDDEAREIAMTAIVEIERKLAIFTPSPGPQAMAATSDADIIGYGGAAGGGKSYLVSGLALTEHQRSLIIRQQKTQTNKFVQDFTKVLGSRDGYSSQTSSWTTEDGRLIEFGGLDNEGDEEKWQGRDHDLKAFDEATQMRETQVRYIAGWNRTDAVGQRCRTLLTFNPPTTVEGRWVIKFFAPWLDAKYPGKRAVDGELRYFITLGDDASYETPVERGKQPLVVVNGKIEYDFDPAEYQPEDIIIPKSRTFITARVTDNPYYMATGYINQLQQLPEPLRSQMLKGDFSAGVEDAANQLIPTAWVEAAMERWLDHQAKGLLPGPMDSMGVDAARGGNMGATMGAIGKDKMVISRRHGRWFAPLISIKGVDVNSGSLAAAQMIRFVRDHAPVHLDVVGIGTSPYDYMQDNGQHVIAINGAAGSDATDASGLLSFVNLRAEMMWMLREALDPDNRKDDPLLLPDDAELLADLTAPIYWFGPRGIQVESKDDLKKRIKRSPDKGDAVVYALRDTPKRKTVVGPLAMSNEAILAMARQGIGEDDRFNELK